jgi:hypothetical protein
MPSWRGAHLRHRDNFTFFNVFVSVLISYKLDVRKLRKMHSPCDSFTKRKGQECKQQSDRQRNWGMFCRFTLFP